MAWATKYLFKFDSDNGVETRILIQKAGYSGNVIQRHVGRAPVLKKQKNGPISGTSLELFAECAVDGEFSELYTSDPKEYRVQLYRGNTLIWFGFISTELYSEPSIAPPYDVQIIATDGLGELKLTNFAAQGKKSLIALLTTLLSFTGSSRDFYFATNIKHAGGTRQQMPDWEVDIDFMQGETCYDTLTRLLDSIHATITPYGDRWLIARETDIQSLLSSGSLSVISYSGGASSITTLTSIEKSVGKMGVADLWPEGYLSSAIEPARKAVIVQAPWHMKQGVKDATMTDSTSANWIRDSHVRFVTEKGRGYYLSDGWNDYQKIVQEFQIANLNTPLSIKVLAAPGSTYLMITEARLQLYVEYTSDGNTWVGTEDGWVWNNPHGNSIPWFELGKTIAGAGPEDTQEYSVTIPALKTDAAGTLRLVIRGYQAYVCEANLEIVQNDGFQDTINIDNGARGSESPVEIIGPRIPSGGLENIDFYQGIWTYGGTVLTSFEDSHHSNADLLSIIALSRAISAALPREKKEGNIDTPSSLAGAPILLVFDEIPYLLDTYDWDLVKDSLRISAISIPAATLTVESEVIEPIREGAKSTTSGTSGIADVGGSSSSGRALINYFEEDGDGNIKLKDEYGGLWTKGFLTAGGVGQSSGGGGGGVDIVRVWKSLQNQDTINTYNAYKISTAHLPTLGSGLAYTDNQGSGESLATTLGIASGYKLPTTEEWNSVAGSVEALQSLQAQIDSVASRDNFDELTATALFADVLAASDIYGELHGNAETASYLVGSSYSAGSDSVPVYFSGGRPVACTASSLFASLTSATQKNLSITIAGQTREIAALYATYDGSGNTITAHYATASALNGVSNRVTALEGRQNWDEIFGLDENGNVYVKKNGNAARGFWTYGFVTAGGVGTGGGGGGGDVDLTRLWKSLQNQDTINTYNAYKISTAHLPTLGSGLAYTDNQGSGESLATTLGIASGYKLPTSEEWANVADNLNSLQALQAQVDSVATRDNFDELTASALFSDIVAGTTGYFETVYGSLEGNASSATYATSAGSATSAGYASSAGSATYDSDSENISTCFSTISTALKSLQSQIDSVATRNAFDELVASVISADTIAAASFFGALHGNADSATNATNAAYATYDTASENIASNFTTVGTALKSLQAQIDSVAANRAFDELTVTAGYFDMLSVGANLNVAGTIYSVKGIYSSGYVTAGAVGASSDERLKDDITTISEERAKDVIMALRPCEWVWNEKHSTLEGRKFAGLIAQEVQKVLPDAVLDSREELLLFHNVFHGYEIRMLQDHERRIKALELARE